MVLCYSSRKSQIHSLPGAADFGLVPVHHPGPEVASCSFPKSREGFVSTPVLEQWIFGWAYGQEVYLCSLSNFSLCFLRRRIWESSEALCPPVPPLGPSSLWPVPHLSCEHTVEARGAKPVSSAVSPCVWAPSYPKLSC